LKLKLDENLGGRAQTLFRAAEHDVETAYSEGLSGASDQSIYNACCAEGRCLVTLDLDFADPVRFSAHRCGGIIVLRTPGSASSSVLEALLRQCIQGLHTIDMNNNLWIVEPTRIRVRQFEKD